MGRSSLLGFSRASRSRGRRGQELASAIVACQEPPLVTDAQLALGKFMHEHRAAHVMRTLRQRGQLQCQPLDHLVAGHRLHSASALDILLTPAQRATRPRRARRAPLIGAVMTISARAVDARAVGRRPLPVRALPRWYDNSPP